MFKHPSIWSLLGSGLWSQKFGLYEMDGLIDTFEIHLGAIFQVIFW